MLEFIAANPPPWPNDDRRVARSSAGRRHQTSEKQNSTGMRAHPVLIRELRVGGGAIQRLASPSPLIAPPADVNPRASLGREVYQQTVNGATPIVGRSSSCLRRRIVLGGGAEERRGRLRQNLCTATLGRTVP